MDVRARTRAPALEINDDAHCSSVTGGEGGRSEELLLIRASCMLGLWWEEGGRLLELGTLHGLHGCPLPCVLRLCPDGRSSEGRRGASVMSLMCSCECDGSL